MMLATLFSSTPKRIVFNGESGPNTICFAEIKKSYPELAFLLVQMSDKLWNDNPNGIMHQLYFEKKNCPTRVRVWCSNSKMSSTDIILGKNIAFCNAGSTYEQSNLNQFINQKFFIPNYHIIVDDFFEYYADSQGRTSKVIATLNKDKYLKKKNGDVDKLRDEKRCNLAPVANLKDGNGKYIGGHLIGNYFNGPTEAINIVPMSNAMNLQEWGRMEKFMKQIYTEGGTVYLEIDIEYGDSSVPVRISALTKTDTGEKQLFKYLY